MNMKRSDLPHDLPSEQRLAREVLELGESLFETALEVGNQQHSTGVEGEVYPLEELRTASQEFFSALRLLLGIEI